MVFTAQQERYLSVFDRAKPGLGVLIRKNLGTAAGHLVLLASTSLVIAEQHRGIDKVGRVATHAGSVLSGLVALRELLRSVMTEEEGASPGMVTFEANLSRLCQRLGLTPEAFVALLNAPLRPCEVS